MPKGKGTYGKQRGKPSKEDKKMPFNFFNNKKKGKKEGKK
jgi:hypothetical protein